MVSFFTPTSIVKTGPGSLYDAIRTAGLEEGCVFAFDAGDPSSYSGNQTVTSLVGDVQSTLGRDTGTTDDPTFVGTVGAQEAQYFTRANNTQIFQFTTIPDWQPAMVEYGRTITGFFIWRKPTNANATMSLLTTGNTTNITQSISNNTISFDYDGGTGRPIIARSARWNSNGAPVFHVFNASSIANVKPISANVTLFTGMSMCVSNSSHYFGSIFTNGTYASNVETIPSTTLLPNGTHAANTPPIMFTTHSAVTLNTSGARLYGAAIWSRPGNVVMSNVNFSSLYSALLATGRW